MILWDRFDNEEKANADAGRFLLEWYLSDRCDDGEVLVLKKHAPEHESEGEELELHATVLSLCYESVDAPMNPNGTRAEVEKWIVIGSHRSKVDEEVETIRKEVVRARQSALEVAVRTTRMLHEAVVSNAKSSPLVGEWDVVGNWTIRCPSIETRWNTGRNGTKDILDLTLTTQLFSQRSSRVEQLFIQYNFNIIDGNYKVEKVPLDSHSLDVDDEFGNDDDEFVGRRQVYLHPNCTVIFGGVCCTELKGRLHNDITGWVRFTGLRTGPSEVNPPIEDWEAPNDA